MARRGKIRIGISGWTYRPWRGVFYPAGLPQSQELRYAAQRFGAIEINGTFYGMQRPSSFSRWRAAAGDDIVFAIKGSRFITHMLRLRRIETPLANFLASGLLNLGPELGPILWQFPARQPFDPGLFREFFEQLPRTTMEAASLAARHDARLEGRSATVAEVDQPMRYAVEIRHDSFRSPEFIDLLSEFNVALVVADTVEWPLLMDVTSDFVYCRLHGSLDRWATRVLAWAAGTEPDDAMRVRGPAGVRRNGRDVFVFFDNDAKVRAPFDAMGLIERVRKITPEAVRPRAS